MRSIEDEILIKVLRVKVAELEAIATNAVDDYKASLVPVIKVDGNVQNYYKGMAELEIGQPLYALGETK